MPPSAPGGVTAATGDGDDKRLSGTDKRLALTAPGVGYQQVRGVPVVSGGGYPQCHPRFCPSWVFLHEKAYQVRDTAIESSVVTKVKGVGRYAGRVMDTADYVTPPQVSTGDRRGRRGARGHPRLSPPRPERVV